MSATTRGPRPRTEKDGQEATATVELAILLPVYMLIFVGVMTIGHLVLIRQKVVEAVRFQAWMPNHAQTSGNPQITNNFFATFQPFSAGAGYTGTRTKSDFKFDDGRFAQCYNSFNATQHQKDFAKAVLNDKPTSGGASAQHLVKVHVEGKFQYQPDWMQAFIRTALTEPKSSCTVLHRTTFRQGQPVAERKVMRFGNASKPWEVSNHNPIEDYNLNGGSRFEISTENSSMLASGGHHRFYTPGAKDPTIDESGFVYQAPNGIPDTGNPEPGLWNTGYRLGGSVQSERAIFRQMLGY
jgi:hypothetical protein